MAEPFPISGSIDPRAFPFLLMDLHRNAATGSLKVEGPSYQKALYFRGGRILFGSSNDPRDQLGAILIESGKITPEQLEEVNTKVGPGSPLAKVLSETGFVSQRELSEAARAKVERILSDVIAYSNGTFEFEDGVLPKGAVDLKLSTERLVLAAVRRVADPDFVSRHLEGLDTVLAPTPELAGGSPELRAEASNFIDYLDGQRTVRQAAGAAKLDADEAGRIACGLLFLGMAERRKATADAMPTFVEADADDELDLGQTARMAFNPEPGTVPMGAPMAQPDSEQPFYLPDLTSTDPVAPVVQALPFDRSPRDAASSTDFEMVNPEPTLPIGYDTSTDPTVGFAQSPAFESAEPTVFAQPEPSEPVTSFEMVTPEAIPLPAANPEPPPPKRPAPASHAAPPLVRPPSRNPVNRTLPSVSMTAPLAPRPSKEDLAALDALLNTAPPEGPLEPMEAGAPVEEQWAPRRSEPHPDPGDYAPRPMVRSPSRTPLIVAMGATMAAFLALAALGWRYFTTPKVAARAGTRPAAAATVVPRPVPTPSPVAAPVTPAPMPSANVPSAQPSAATPLAANTPNAGLPTAAPSAVPLPARTPEPPRPPADDLGNARSLLQGGRLSEAAGGFVKTLRRAPAGTASVQLLVACSNETVQKAVDNVGSSELFIVPVSFKGRDCYRLCWGLYQGEARAASAVRSVPEYFRRGGASPRVVSASEILP